MIKVKVETIVTGCNFQAWFPPSSSKIDKRVVAIHFIEENPKDNLRVLQLYIRENGCLCERVIYSFENPQTISQLKQQPYIIQDEFKGLYIDILGSEIT